MKTKLDKYTNDYRLAELKKEKNLIFGKDGFFYEVREISSLKEIKKLQPSAMMKKFRRYQFGSFHIIIECRRDKFRIVLVVKDSTETKSIFYFCLNDYRFIRIIKYQTIHKEEFETYVRGSGEQNYTFKRNEMFYTAAGNQYLCPAREYSWEPFKEVSEPEEIEA